MEHLLTNHTVFLTIVGGLAIVFSLIINRLFLKFSTLGVRNLENTDIIRWSLQTKPSVGGISFFIVFLLSVCVYYFSPFDDGMSQTGLGLLAACTVGFLVGLADDAYDTPPYFKFFGQFLCGNILYFTGIFIDLTPVVELNYTFTIFWVIAIMNSVNMLDNMDGITASTSVFILLCCALGITFDGGGTGIFGFTTIGVLGALLGFLYYNWNPAKMYMGDTGSQFLGVFLAAISSIYLWQFKSASSANFIDFSQFLLPVLAFSPTIIDTTTVSIRRVLRGQSPFVGGRDHTTHHLAMAGLKDWQVGLVFVLVGLVNFSLVGFLINTWGSWEWWYALAGLIYFLTLLLGIQAVYWYNGKKSVGVKKMSTPATLKTVHKQTAQRS